MPQLALQLYSIRDDARADLPGILRQLATWPLDGVELAGLYDHTPRDVRQMLDDASLACPSSHAAWESLQPDRFDDTVAAHKTLGCDWLIIPYLPPQLRDTVDRCRATCDQLVDITHKLEALGLRTGYHAHDGDMKPLDDTGITAWDCIARHTPGSFIMQYDTANGMAGGADPVEPLRAYPGRGASTHLKPYSHQGGHGQACIGEDDIPWSAVFDACRDIAGTRWYVVEQEGHRTLTPMDAAHQSVKAARELLATHHP